MEKLKNRLHCQRLLVALLAVLSTPSWAAECWQGWGYLVDPQTLAYKSGQSLYVTQGQVDWRRREWIRLYPIDQSSGRRVDDKEPVFIRPTKPTRKGTNIWSSDVEDIADVQGSKWSMMLRFTHIRPPDSAPTLDDKFSRWACGLGDTDKSPHR